MDAEKSKTNKNSRFNAFAFRLRNVAFYTIFRLWHFNVFHSTYDCRKFDHYPYSFKKDKQQIASSATNFCCHNWTLLQLNFTLKYNMPANPKYLNPSFWPRFSKITAAILGGYFVSVTFHLALAAWFSRKDVLITMAFSGFILWVALMIIAFLAKSGWKIWGVYILLTLLFCLFIYLGQTYNTAQ